MRSRPEYRLRRSDPRRETAERALREIGAGVRPELTTEAHAIRRAQYLMARKAFPTDTALAEAVGVHRSQITRWKAGDPASPENAWLLRDLAFAAETLSEHLDTAASHAWLHGRSPELNGETPLDAIRGGRVADVLMALQAQVGGAYV
jgi:hypothetical protein